MLEDKEMYLEVKDVKKSYGSDAGYTQVLKGVTTDLTLWTAAL